MRKIFVAFLALAGCASLILSACVAKPENNNDEEYTTESIESFTPATDEGEDGELALSYAECRENLSLAFSGMTETPAESFAFEETDGGLKIVDFVGDESIVVIPESFNGTDITEISAGAFSSKGIRAVYVPDSVKTIGPGALENSEGLTTVRLPFVGDGAENCFIGYAFGAQNHSQNALKLPASLQYVIIGEGAVEIADNAFAGCKDIVAVSLPQSVKKIGEFAFFECNDLICIDIGGAEEIEKYAFGYCESLYSVSFAGVKSLGEGALVLCSSLYSLELSFDEENRFIGYVFGASSADYNDEFVPKSLRRVIVADGCSEIPNRAFAACAYITDVRVPDGVTTVGIRAFYACRSIRKISLPDSVVSLGDDAFFGCDNLSEVTLGEELESIGMQAFYGCSVLETIDLGGASKIGKNAFYGCDSLTPPDTSGVIDVAEGNDKLFKSENDTTEEIK